MKVRFLSISASLLSTGLVSLAFIMRQLYWPAVLFLLVIVVIILLPKKFFTWIHIPSLYLFFGTIVAGLYLHLSEIFLFSGAIIFLAGWDLADFSKHIDSRKQEKYLDDIKRRHFLRLGFTLVAGICIVLVSSSLNLRISFGWVSVLVILSAIGIGQLISRLLRLN